MPVVNIRRANPSDSLEIARVHVKSWQTTYRGIVPQAHLDNLTGGKERRAEYWHRALTEEADSSSQSSRATFVAETNIEIVGFASAGRIREALADTDYDCELYAIYLLQSSQRQGIGKKLVHEIAKAMVSLGFKSILVWVLTANPSRNFYAALEGKEMASKMIQMGGIPLGEVAYGWKDIRVMFEATNEP